MLDLPMKDAGRRTLGPGDEPDENGDWPAEASISSCARVIMCESATASFDAVVEREPPSSASAGGSWSTRSRRDRRSE